jgi:hypothetical protein
VSRSITYLSRRCRHWGGELILVSRPVFVDLAADLPLHPRGSHAIDRTARRVIVERRHANPGTIIHEMGHVFLEEGDPVTTFEPDWLGWDIALARNARCFRAWSRQNADYGVTFDDYDLEWASFSREERARLIADRIDYAQTLGLLSQKGEPLCTRR